MEKRYTYRILVRKLEGKGPLGKPRCRWVNNIKRDRQDGIGWITLIWLRIGNRYFVSMVMKLWVPQNSGKLLSSCATGSF
jgi:hypothetical protein